MNSIVSGYFLLGTCPRLPQLRHRGNSASYGTPGKSNRTLVKVRPKGTRLDYLPALTDGPSGPARGQMSSPRWEHLHRLENNWQVLPKWEHLVATPAAVKLGAAAFCLLACPREGCQTCWMGAGFPPLPSGWQNCPHLFVGIPKGKDPGRGKGKGAQANSASRVLSLIQSSNAELPLRALPRAGGVLGLWSHWTWMTGRPSILTPMWQLGTHAGQPLQLIPAPAWLFHMASLPAAVSVAFLLSPLQGVSSTTSLLLPAACCFHFTLSVASWVWDPLPPSQPPALPGALGGPTSSNYSCAYSSEQGGCWATGGEG